MWCGGGGSVVWLWKCGVVVVDVVIEVWLEECHLSGSLKS